MFHQYLGVLALLFLLVGMLASTAMMSMGVIGLAINWVINRQVGHTVGQWARHPVLWGLVLLFGVMLASGLWSENAAYWVDRMRMKLPFLLLPAALLAIPRFDKQVYYPLLGFFVLLMAGTCAYLTGWYVFHFEAANAGYSRGQVLPTPVMHIRFSLMVAYSVAICFVLAREGWHLRWRWERGVWVVLGLFLLVFQHILAVRSGLVALYGVLFYFVVAYIFIARRWWQGVALAMLAVLVAAGTYHTIPSLRNKIDYTLHNLAEIRHQNIGAELSDPHRIGTIHAGLHLGQTHPWTGVGMGDIRDATEVFLQAHYPTIAGHGFTPQSQAVLFFAAIGWPGLLLFLAVVLLPLVYRQGWKQPLLGSFLAVGIPSLFIEQTWETQLGVAFYLTFLLMAMRFYGDTETQPCVKYK